MSQDPAYKTGGPSHIIVKQPGEALLPAAKETARSTEYVTDVAKMIQAPISHVANGDDS